VSAGPGDAYGHDARAYRGHTGLPQDCQTEAASFRRAGRLDFITYFETSELEEFHAQVVSLEQIKEFQYTRQFGHSTLMSVVKSVNEIIEALA